MSYHNEITHKLLFISIGFCLLGVMKGSVNSEGRSVL